MRALAVWSLLGLLASVEAAAATVRCDAETKYRCASDGCLPVEATTYAILDHRAGTYARCDERGCDQYPAKFARSGDFVNITLPDRGTMAKLSLSESQFLEVATLGIETFTSFGTCAVER